MSIKCEIYTKVALSRLAAAIERHRPEYGMESLSLRHIGKSGLFEECDEFARYVVLGVFKSVQQLNEKEQPPHHEVGGEPPISDM